MPLNRDILDNIRPVEPYVPGEQPKGKVVKLNTNENPYPPAPGVDRILKEMDPESLRLYPDPTADVLVKALADFYQVKKEQIFVGVGSDDVLSMCFLTFFNSGKPILFPDITYSFYPVWAKLYGIPFECQPLDEEFHLISADYEKENGGIVFPNPNAPTSVYESLDVVEEIVDRNPNVVVIVDEAYIDFAGESALKLIDRYPNLIVVQTFSKSRSMAGMRIGYAIGNEELIRCLNEVKYSVNSYTLNQTAILCGAEAVKDRDYFQKNIDRIVRTRQRTQNKLKELGFQFPDPKGNFIFATHPDWEASRLFAALKEQGIYVRYWDKPRIDDYLRITIGTDEEMDTLFSFLGTYLS